MTTTDGQAAEGELDEGYDLPLSETARYEVTLGTTFTYRGLSHWPKVTVSDGMLLVQPAPEAEFEPEGAESLVYRVEQIAHARLDAVIARMKRDIDARYHESVAARVPPSTGAADETPPGENG